MGESAKTPLAVAHATRPRGRALLPLLPLIAVVFVISGGAATLVGVLLSLAVTGGLRPWAWALSGALTAVVAGVLLDRGATAATRRFPQLTEWFRPGD
jgi:membrane associated rhomboid family serine protease